jgi:tartrate dehydratase alpha subunit/fumarate hydratase class I-like protein
VRFFFLGVLNKNDRSKDKVGDAPRHEYDTVRHLNDAVRHKYDAPRHQLYKHISNHHVNQRKNSHKNQETIIKLSYKKMNDKLKIHK